MKIQFVNTFFLRVLAILLLAQTVTHAQSKFGVRAGLNVSNASFDNLPDKRERFGYHVGVFADVPVLPGFMSLQPELNYSTKGAAYKPLNERKTLDLNYVDFLLPVAFHLGSIDIQVGPF